MSLVSVSAKRNNCTEEEMKWNEIGGVRVRTFSNFSNNCTEEEITDTDTVTEGRPKDGRRAKASKNDCLLICNSCL